MKLQAVLALLAIISSVKAVGEAHRAVVHKRQGTSSSSASSTARSSSAGPPAPSPSTPAPSPSSTRASTTTSSRPASTTSSAARPTGPPPLDTGTGIPPLESLTFGMATQATIPVTATFPAGAVPPVSGAPPLPTPFVFRAADWPAQDKAPDPNSPEVQEWMRELDGYTIPDIPPTVDGSCLGDPAAAADAANRGWWTCGGYTRATDITVCPDKYTFGVSFDDGPARHTQKLLNYLNSVNIHATFFVVGSRVIERPDVLREEYMSGHEISVHTWSHSALTKLSTAAVVAELGWTRKAIKQVLGITPTTMRPPYGDIDDRVRAISLAMGMVPIIWTRTPSAGKFDSNDWRVADGTVTGNQSVATFQGILNNASAIDTGFIVLQHDLFEVTVDLAVGYTLPLALSNNPPLTLQPIGQCSHIPTTDLYLESNTNQTFPPPHRQNSSAASLALPLFALLLGTTLSFIGGLL